MGYRDESETLKARIRELEARADRLRARVAENEAPLPKTKELVWEAEIDGTLDEEAYDEMVELLRRELDPNGKLQRIGSTLTWSIEPTQVQPIARMVTVTIESRRGKTRIRIVEHLRNLYNQNILGFTLGLSWIGAVPLAAGLAAASPLLVPVGAIAPFVGVYMWAKRRYQKISRERRRELGAVVHDLEEIARRRVHVRARVEEQEEEEGVEVEEMETVAAMEGEA